MENPESSFRAKDTQRRVRRIMAGGQVNAEQLFKDSTTTDMTPRYLRRFSYSAADAKVLLLILLSIELLLVAAYVTLHILAPEMKAGPLRNFFNVDREVSIPTWFSSIQLFAVGAVLMLQAGRARELRIPFVVAALAFIFLSMDEAAAVHDAIYKTFEARNLPFIGHEGYLVWMAAYVIVAIFALFVGYRAVLFVWRSYRREAWWILAGGALFCTGGIVIEIITHRLFHIAVDTTFFLAVAAEELLEMAGVSVILYGLLLLTLGWRDET
jgi:hypothetical protein